jgi:hypothetical protein
LAFWTKSIVPGTSGNSRNLHGNNLGSSIPPQGKKDKRAKKMKNGMQLYS